MLKERKTGYGIKVFSEVGRNEDREVMRKFGEIWGWRKEKKGMGRDGGEGRWRKENGQKEVKVDG